MLSNHILNIVLSHLCHSCHSHSFQQESEPVLLAHIWYRSLCICNQHNATLGL